MSDKQYSPLAQIVSNAANEAYWLWDQMCPADADTIAAATLRAVAEWILPNDIDPDGDWTVMDEFRYQFLVVIKELEEK